MNKNKISHKDSLSGIGNIMLVGMDREFFDAFCFHDNRPKVYIKTGRTAGEITQDGTLICDYSPLKFSEIDHVFCPNLPVKTADKVRDLAMPYYLRNINRSQRSKSERAVTWADYNSRLEIMIHWYYRKLTENDIKAVVFESVPHGGSDIALYFLAKELNLKLSLCLQSNFVNRFVLVNDFSDIGVYKKAYKGEPNNDVKASDNPEPPFYMPKLPGRFSLLMQYCWLFFELQYNRIALFFGAKNKIRPKSRKMQTTLDGIKMLSVQRRQKKETDLEKPFIYLPLHFQPEMTVDVLGHKYSDQILLVEELRRVVPDDIYIYVKDNPYQTYYAREASFFKRLNAIPNTIYVDTNISSYKLIQNCESVATIVGTAGWEALQMGKPVICFGYAWWKCLPGVFDWDKKPSWKDVSKFKYKKEKLHKAVRNLSVYFHEGVYVPKSFSEVVEDFNPQENARNVTRKILDYLSKVNP